MNMTEEPRNPALPGRGLRRKRWALGIGVAAVATLPLAMPSSATAREGDRYRQTNLVSDISGVARFTDPNLVNPWGLVAGPTTPWWVSDNNSGKSTLYNGAGQPVPVPPAMPLVVTIPPATGAAAGNPTGVVFNGSGDFVVTSLGKSGASLFIFATEDGTISGWSPTVDLHNAIRAVDNPDTTNGPVYKGLALVNNSSGNFLLAANFRMGTIDVFDKNFHAAHLAGSFADSTIPDGFAPFNVAEIGSKVYVTYAKQNAMKHDDVSGPGNGFINVFDTQGNLLKRLASHGALNSPWGLALAPEQGFGDPGENLLVGNFGDGHINVLSPGSGRTLGALNDEDGNPITIGGLWAIQFGRGANAPSGPKDTLFFTAGIGEEQHGLFGTIRLDED